MIKLNLSIKNALRSTPKVSLCGEVVNELYGKNTIFSPLKLKLIKNRGV